MAPRGIRFEVVSLKTRQIGLYNCFFRNRTTVIQAESEPIQNSVTIASHWTNHVSCVSAHDIATLLGQSDEGVNIIPPPLSLSPSLLQATVVDENLRRNYNTMDKSPE